MSGRKLHIAMITAMVVYLLYLAAFTGGVMRNRYKAERSSSGEVGVVDISLQRNLIFRPSRSTALSPQEIHDTRVHVLEARQVRSHERQHERQAERQRVAAARQAQEKAQEAPQPPPKKVVKPQSVWARIAQCIRAIESGGNYQAVSASGKYRGAYQFDRRTWRSVGGAGDPAAASPAEQDHRARLLWQSRGLQPWPTPARRC